jgi:glucosylceramidase
LCDYFIKAYNKISLIIYFDLCCSFLQAYQKEGIDIWGLTAQNEPGDGYYVYFGINSCGYSPEEERNFVANNLGPTLQKHDFGKVLILGCDDQRTVIPEWAEVVSAAPTLTDM